MEKEMSKLAVHLFLIRQGKILLSRRYNTGFEDGNYSMVAGHVDQGEDLGIAMIREAHEEAGIIIAPEDLQCIGIIYRRTTDTRIDFFFEATAWSGEAYNMEPDKCDDLDWFDTHNLPENIIPYIHEAISMYLRHNHLRKQVSDHVWFKKLS